MASSSNSVPTSRNFKYDIFLSFRGKDTRKNFLSHLFEALKTAGFNVFRDEKIERGEAVADELLKAIRESQCSIVVLSKNYASSTWCLNELVEIIEQWMNNKSIEYNYKVYPVFSGVDPSDVGKLKGEFAVALARHEKTFNLEMILKWRKALTRVAKISGYHLNNKEEADAIKEIVGEISRKLRGTYTETNDGLVAIEERLEELKQKMCLESEGVRFINICGMGGIGKTTLARFAYDSLMIPTDFQGKTFLADVREKTTKILQRQILSDILKEKTDIWNDQEGANMIRNRLRYRKVLLVIDDVDDAHQLKYLAGHYDWFGSGSRIIITSRDESILKMYEVRDIYRISTLKTDEALQLLNLKAFGKDQCGYDFVGLCKLIVQYADGLPLALEVLGSFLRGRSVREWKSAIEQLKTDTADKIFNTLKISFDGLEETYKRIFLDIACFFRGEDYSYVREILEACDFHPDIGISVLIEKSLLTIDQKKKTLWMHDLLQDMGRKIVEQESVRTPGERSRLWKEDDICRVLTQNTGTERIEVIMLMGYEVYRNIYLDSTIFLNMKNLRLLIIHYSGIFHDIPFTHFPSDLKVLDWHNCPLTSWPSSFQMEKLVRLDLSYGGIVKLWEEIKPISRLKSINLNLCENLEKTPNLEGAFALEDLSFISCSKLSSVHSSIGNLMKLINLDFSLCSSLTMLPRKMNGLKSLKTLCLFQCHNLDKLPKDLGELECLEVLDASYTSITHLPSMYCLINLVTLNLRYCERLMEIHPSVGTLRQLDQLNLSNCINIASLPSDVHGWESLRFLHLFGCSKLENLPANMGEAKLLEELDLSGSPLVDLKSLNGLVELDGNCNETFFKSLQLSNWFSLTTLDFSGNRHLVSLPQFVCQLTKLEILRLRDCKKLIILPNFKGLSSLKELDISCCNLPDGVIPNDLGSLTSLEILNLTNNDFISLPQSLQQLSRLHTLNLSSCKRFKFLSSSSSLNNLAVVCSSSSLLVPNLNEDDVRSSRSFDNTPPFVCHKRLFAREVPRYNLYAEGCASLSLLTLSKIIIWCGTCIHLQLTNCSRLADSEGCASLSILKMFFQEHLSGVTKFSFIVLGNDLVNWWFHQRKKGSDMKINDFVNVLCRETEMKLPTGLRNDTEWMGLLFCIVFAMDLQERGEYFEIYLNNSMIVIDSISSSLSNNQIILFLSPEKCFAYRLFDDKHFKMSIETTYEGVVKEIGMRVLYKKDVEEVIQNKYEIVGFVNTQETTLSSDSTTTTAATTNSTSFGMVSAKVIKVKTGKAVKQLVKSGCIDDAGVQVMYIDKNQAMEGFKTTCAAVMEGLIKKSN